MENYCIWLVIYLNRQIMIHCHSQYRMSARMNLYPLTICGVYIHLLISPCDCESLIGYRNNSELLSSTSLFTLGVTTNVLLNHSTPQSQNDSFSNNAAFWRKNRNDYKKKSNSLPLLRFEGRDNFNHQES